MRLAFFGYGELGAVILEGVLDHHTVELVVTHRPDFGELGESQVLDLAEKRALPLRVSSHAREPEVAESLRAARVDIVVSANWRTMVPADLLAAAPLGALNVHDALLPRYSGFGAINWAIRNGERETGVTVHRMEAELDTGPIVTQTVVPIGEHETAADVYEAVTGQYVPTMLRALERRAAGEAGTPQDRRQRTFYHRIRQEDVRIDWSRPTRAVYDLVRAQSDPYVNAWTTYEGQPLAVKVARLPEDTYCGTPGRLVRRAEGGVAVVCGPPGHPDSSGLVLDTVQPEGGGSRPAAEFFPRMAGYLV